ncbi:MAG: hypothetical protein DI582_09205 [Azospirillum brasilense]|nr:MAG: hypothetical protein DI582_09205 [Azospirillum brasilense]
MFERIQTWGSQLMQRVRAAFTPSQPAQQTPSPQDASAEQLLRYSATQNDHNNDRFTSAAESARSVTGALVGLTSIAALRAEHPVTVQHYTMRVIPANAQLREAGIEYPSRGMVLPQSFIAPDRVVAHQSALRDVPALEGGGVVNWLRNLLPHRMQEVRLSDLCDAHPELNCTKLPNQRILVSSGRGTTA